MSFLLTAVDLGLHVTIRNNRNISSFEMRIDCTSVTADSGPHATLRYKRTFDISKFEIMKVDWTSSTADFGTTCNTSI